MPQGHKVIPAVWSMKRKRRIMTQEVYKWKARLNVHGGKQIKGVHYWETASPVVRWSSVRLLLTLSILEGWKTRQIDFVMTYPQADISSDVYMAIPPGVQVSEDEDNSEYCLLLLKNLYGGKDAGRT